MMNLARTDNVLAEVEKERMFQHSKWGEQDHPDGTERWGKVKLKDSLTLVRAINLIEEGAGETNWTGVLLEEVLEAVTEKDPKALRAELIQIAAVAVAWVEAIDRRGQPKQAELWPEQVAVEQRAAVYPRPCTCAECCGRLTGNTFGE